jgi:hypothetical protein
MLAAVIRTSAPHPYLLPVDAMTGTLGLQSTLDQDRKEAARDTR